VLGGRKNLSVRSYRPGSRSSDVERKGWQPPKNSTSLFSSWATAEESLISADQAMFERGTCGPRNEKVLLIAQKDRKTPRWLCNNEGAVAAEVGQRGKKAGCGEERLLPIMRRERAAPSTKASKEKLPGARGGRPVEMPSRQRKKGVVLTLILGAERARFRVGGRLGKEVLPSPPGWGELFIGKRTPVIARLIR